MKKDEELGPNERQLMRFSKQRKKEPKKAIRAARAMKGRET